MGLIADLFDIKTIAKGKGEMKGFTYHTINKKEGYTIEWVELPKNYFKRLKHYVLKTY